MVVVVSGLLVLGCKSTDTETYADIGTRGNPRNHRPGGHEVGAQSLH